MLLAPSPIVLPQPLPHTVVATATQNRFIDAVFSGAFRYLGYGGAIRGGKSFAIMLAVFLLCRFYPGSRWAIVRKDLPTLRRNTIPTFNRVRPASFCGRVHQTTWTARCVNGSEIVFFPEGYKDDKDLERWKGLEVNGFVLEEASELQEASNYKAIERAGSWIIPGTPHQPPPYVFYTFNPTWNWVRDVFYTPWKHDQMQAPYFFQPATILDNPHLPEAYKESLKNLPTAQYRRFVLGDWEMLEGRAFDELNEKIHIVPSVRVRDWMPVWSSLDWGYQHPFAAGEFTLDHEGVCYVVDSVHGQKQLPHQIGERMKRQLSPRSLLECYTGHDTFAKRIAYGGGETPSIGDQLALEGIYCHKANIHRVHGWNVIRNRVTVQPRLERNWNEVEARWVDEEVPQKPTLLFCDTPNNRKTFENLQRRMVDPDDLEDVLKEDAKIQDGRAVGGDDPSDMVRYGTSIKLGSPDEPEQVRPRDLEGTDPESHEALYPNRDEVQAVATGDMGSLGGGF